MRRMYHNCYDLKRTMLIWLDLGGGLPIYSPAEFHSKLDRE
jgi:hypothetical protein